MRHARLAKAVLVSAVTVIAILAIPGRVGEPISDTELRVLCILRAPDDLVAGQFDLVPGGGVRRRRFVFDESAGVRGTGLPAQARPGRRGDQLQPAKGVPES